MLASYVRVWVVGVEPSLSFNVTEIDSIMDSCVATRVKDCLLLFASATIFLSQIAWL